MQCEEENEGVDNGNNNIKDRNDECWYDECLLVHSHGHNDQDIGSHIAEAPNDSPDAVA